MDTKRTGRTDKAVSAAKQAEMFESQKKFQEAIEQNKIAAENYRRAVNDVKDEGTKKSFTLLAEMHERQIKMLEVRVQNPNAFYDCSEILHRIKVTKGGSQVAQKHQKKENKALQFVSQEQLKKVSEVTNKTLKSANQELELICDSQIKALLEQLQEWAKIDVAQSNLGMQNNPFNKGTFIKLQRSDFLKFQNNLEKVYKDSLLLKSQLFQGQQHFEKEMKSID